MISKKRKHNSGQDPLQGFSDVADKFWIKSEVDYSSCGIWFFSWSYSELSFHKFFLPGLMYIV